MAQSIWVRVGVGGWGGIGGVEEGGKKISSEYSGIVFRFDKDPFLNHWAGI